MHRHTAIALAAITATAALFIVTLLWPHTTVAPTPNPESLPSTSAPPPPTTPTPETPPSSQSAEADSVTVRGIVTFRDAEIRPASNVLVQAIPENTNYGDLIETISGDDGRFTLTFVPGHNHLITAVAPPGWAAINGGSVTANSESPQEDREITVVLWPAHNTASGTVYIRDDRFWQDYIGTIKSAGTFDALREALIVDATRGRPAPGITVTATNTFDTRRATTDANGRYHLAGLADRDYRFTLEPGDGPPIGLVEASPYSALSQGVSFGRNGQTGNVDFVIEPDRLTFHGRVVDTDGNPITEAFVTAEVDSENFSYDTYSRQLAESIEARTGADGRFQMEGLFSRKLYTAATYVMNGNAFEYRFRIDADGYARKTQCIPVVSAPAHEAAMAYFEQLWRLTGRRGIPTPQAELPLVDGTDIAEIEFVLEPAASLIVSVVDEHGDLQRGYPVRLSEENARGAFISEPVGRPSELDDRCIIFDKLAPGEYLLSVFKARPPESGQLPVYIDTERILIEPGTARVEHTVQVRSPQFGAIAGMVYDKRTGASVGANAVRVLHVEPDTVGPNPSDGTQYNDGTESGYRIDDISAGLALLLFTQGGYAPAIESVVIKTGETTQHDVYLEPAASLTLQVTYRGEPMHVFYVRVYPVDSDNAIDERYIDERLANSEGRGGHLIEGLPAMPCRLSVEAQLPDGAMIVKSVDVTPVAGLVIPLDIAFTGSTGIRGNILVPGDRDVRQAFLINPADYDAEAEVWMLNEHRVATVACDSDTGEFETPALEPGDYILVIGLYDRFEFDPPLTYTKPITLTENQWTTLTLDLTDP